MFVNPLLCTSLRNIRTSQNSTLSLCTCFIQGLYYDIAQVATYSCEGVQLKLNQNSNWDY
jgi:hypothetical protein